MKQILGIDVGGSKIAAGLVDSHCRVSQVSIIPTSRTDLPGQLVRLIKDYQGFAGLGLGMPGQILSDGRVVKLGNLKTFPAHNVKKALQQKFKVPVHVMNDAKAFTLAEATIGAGRGYPIVVGVTLGTGIGVGVAMNGQIYQGADGIASELGRLPMTSGKLFEQEVREAGGFKNPAKAKKYLKLLISYVILSFNPQLIIMSGGWTRMPKMNQLIDEARRQLTYQTKVKVALSKLKHAGIIGAALPLLRR